MATGKRLAECLELETRAVEIRQSGGQRNAEILDTYSRFDILTFMPNSLVGIAQ